MTLREIFGAGFSDSEVDKVVYSRDASDFEGEALAVVWPREGKQIHNLVAYAKRFEYNLVPRGAGTGLQGGCVPARSIVVDMSKMNKVLEVGLDYVWVEAGAVWDEVDSVLGDKEIAVKPINHKVCTIGGMVAMNSLGVEVENGKISQYVIELEAVDGSGKYLKMGLPALKNFVGLEGTSGIITKVKLKIVKREMKSYMIYKFNTLGSMIQKAVKMIALDDVLSVEYFDDLSSEMVGLEAKNHIVVCFKGDKGSVKEKDEVESLISLKERLYHKLRGSRYTQMEDPKLPLDKMASFLYWLRKNNVPVFGHLKLGIVHPCFKEYSKLPKEMRELVGTLKGVNGAEFGYGLKRRGTLKGELKVKLEVLKEQYDPKNIMNRGKMHE